MTVALIATMTTATPSIRANDASYRHGTAPTVAHFDGAEMTGDDTPDRIAVRQHIGADDDRFGVVELIDGVSGDVLATLSSGRRNDGFGAAVWARSDLDGDGTIDVLVGAPADGAGRVYAFFAAVHRQNTHHVDAGWILHGDPSRGMDFGMGVGVTPDLDGDGLVDIAIDHRSTLDVTVDRASDIWSLRDDRMIAHLSGPSAAHRASVRRADLDGDGLVTLHDRERMITTRAMSREVFDVDGDGMRTAHDLAMLDQTIGGGGEDRRPSASVDFDCDCLGGCLCPDGLMCVPYAPGHGVCVGAGDEICPTGIDDCDVCPQCPGGPCVIAIVDPEAVDDGIGDSIWSGRMLRFSVVPKWATIHTWAVTSGDHHVVVLESDESSMTLGVVSNGQITVHAESIECADASMAFIITSVDDWDGDGYDNDCELDMGTSPWSFVDAPPPFADVDGDGLPDVEEICELGTSAFDFDTDGDGLPDDWEVLVGTNPFQSDEDGDPDGDGLLNLIEFVAQMNPFDADSDDDGDVDGLEQLTYAFDTCEPDFGDNGLIDLAIVNPGTDAQRIILLDEEPAVLCRGESIQFHSTSGQGAHLYESAIEFGHEYVTDTGVGANANDCLSSIFQTHTGHGGGIFRFRWISHPGGGNDPCIGSVDVELRDPMYIAAPDKTDDARCLVLVNRGDADGDRIPDFADGYDFDPDDPNDDISSSDRFTPLTINVPDLSESSSPTIVFGFDLADPEALNVYDGQLGPVYAATTGTLRLWRTDAGAMRDVDVDLIRPDEPYTLEDFGLPETGGPLVVYVESVRTSQEIGDQRVHVTIDGCVDVIGFTGFAMRYGTINAAGGVQNVDLPPVSLPAPTFDMSVFTVENIRPSSEGLELIADINVAGVLDDALSDITPGEEGVIDRIDVFVDGVPLTTIDQQDGYVITIPPEGITKGEQPTTIDRPFDFSASFAEEIVGARLNAGFNIIRLEAVNARGFVGYAELIVEVTAEAPADETFGIDIEFITERSQVIGAFVDATAGTMDDDGQPSNESISGLLWNAVVESTFDGPLDVSVDGVIGGNGEPFDPIVNESFFARVTIGPFDIIDRIVFFTRRNDASNEFVASFHRTSREYISWAEHELELHAQPVSTSGGGTFDPFVMRLQGPPGLEELIDRIEFAAPDAPDDVVRDFDIINHNGALLLGDAGTNAPEVLLATPSTGAEGLFQTLDSGDLLEILDAFHELNFEFAQGFGHGLWDTGVDIIDSIGLLARTGYHLATKYRSPQWVVRYIRSGDALLEEDRQRVDVAAESVQFLIDRAQALLLDNLDVIVGVLLESDPVLSQLGSSYPVVMNTVVEVIEEIRDLLFGISPEAFGHASGWITGRIVGEAAAELLTAAATAGVGAVALRTSRLIDIVTRLRTMFSSLATVTPNVPGFSPTLMQGISTRLDELASKLLAIVTRRQCFPAGTSVVTTEGVEPIESLEPGDLVSAMDMRTGETSLRVVRRVLRGRAAGLVRLTVIEHGLNGKHERHTIEATPDHPFHVATYGDFVPARDLLPGMLLTTWHGDVKVVVACVEPLAVGAHGADRCAVYNLDVGEDHTYFVSEAAVLVHNACTAPFENAFAVISKIRATNDDIWSSFVEALERTATPPLRARFDAGMPEVCDALMAAMYRDAIQGDTTVDLSKVQSVGDLKAFRASPIGGRLRGHDIDIHHVIPQELATILHRLKFGKDPSREWLDSMPGMLVNKHLHRYGSDGTASFHQIMRQKLATVMEDINAPIPPDEMRASILASIAHAYDTWDPQYGKDFWVVARAWVIDNEL